MPARGRALGLAALAALCFTSGCGTPGTPSVPLPLTHVSSALGSFPLLSFSRNAPAGQTVFTDSTSWAAFWSNAMSGVFTSQPPAMPVVDFSTSAVLFTSMGTRPTGGYVTTFTSLTQTGLDSFIANVKESSPGSCVVAELLTYPADAIVVPRTVAGHVQFTVTRTVDNCGP